MRTLMMASVLGLGALLTSCGTPGAPKPEVQSPPLPCSHCTREKVFDRTTKGLLYLKRVDFRCDMCGSRCNLECPQRCPECRAAKLSCCVL